MKIIEQAEKIFGKELYNKMPNTSLLIFDKESKIVYVNPGYVDVSGLPKELVLGRKLIDLEPESPSVNVLKSGNAHLGGVLSKRTGRTLVGGSIPIWEGNNLQGAVGISSIDKESNSLKTKAKSFIGQSQTFMRILEIVFKVSQTDCSVLISGDSGVGKELIAESIHYTSPRRCGPLVSINCAAIPEHLLESELFGYEPGAFTGAAKQGKLGRIQLAHRGTLFLDEVAEMSPVMQAKLLRVLQEKEIERVGGGLPVPVDFRIVAATNKNLYQLVEEGKFREDLYYRLNVIPIEVPPLRERKADIPKLCKHFLDQSPAPYKTISDATMEVLLDYDWPGNIRQLKNVIDYAAIMSNRVIEPGNLPVLRRSSRQGENSDLLDIIRGKTLEEINRFVQKKALQVTLESTDYNKTEVSRLLGISRQQLYTKAKEFGINLTYVHK